MRLVRVAEATILGGMSPIEPCPAFRERVVVFGPSGSGKSTVGARLAHELGVAFLEGDDLHDADNVERMRAGRPLDEAARGPWLERIADWLDERAQRGEGCVVACSALTRAARARLARGRPTYVYLAVDPEELRRRVAYREHAFMPASLLSSQLATFEPPRPEECVYCVGADGGVTHTVDAALDALRDDGCETVYTTKDHRW